MKKKLLALVLVVVLGITSVVGGTMAYLTDTGNVVNVMTLGNVDIEQTETDRNDDKFKQDQPLFPVVGELNEDDLWTNANVIDKIVTVKNTGSESAYSRTVIAIEIGSLSEDMLHINWAEGVDAERIDTTSIKGSNFVLYVVTHDGELEPGDFYKSLEQVALDSAADNAEVEALDGNNDGIFNILVVSQAIQSAMGDMDAKTALNEGFGVIDKDNHPWSNGVIGAAWDGEADAKGLEENTVGDTVTIYTPAQLAAFRDAVNGGNTYAGYTVELATNINLNNVDWEPIGPNADAANKFKGTFDGKNFTISNLKVNTPDGYTAAGLFGALNGTVKNLNIDGATISHISTGSATDNGIAVVAGSIYTSGAIDNVHVSNATVTGNRYVGGISGYTYGSVTSSSVENITLIATPNAVDGGYDNGDKVGGIAGYFASENVYKIDGNTAANVTIKGYRDMGGIVGAGNAEAVTNNSVSNVTITVDQKTYSYGEKDANADAIVGRKLTGAVDATNSGTATVVWASEANSDEMLKDALSEDKENIYVSLNADVTYDVAAWAENEMGGASTKTITIYGNGHTINFNQTNSDWSNIVTNNNATLVIEDAHVTNSGHNDGPWNRHDLNFACDVVLKNVTSDKAMAFKAGATLTNVTINDPNTSDTYAIWIQPNGQTVTLDGCTINMQAATDGRGIKIDEQYVSAPAKVTLNVSNTKFYTEEKAAILVKSAAGADIYLNNVDISNVAADPINAVWVDEASKDYAHLVKVTNGKAPVNEDDVKNLTDGLYQVNDTYYVTNANGLSYFSAKALTGNNGTAETATIEIMADIDMAGASFSAVVAQRGDTLTVNGNGHTISNVKVVSGVDDNSTGQASMFYAYGGSTLNVSDLTLSNITVTSDADDSGYAAAVVGYCEGTAILNNVDVVNATVTGAKSSGVLVGHLSGSLTATDCDVSGTVTLTNYEADGHYAGKYIGTLASTASLNNCTADVTVDGNLKTVNNGDIYGRNLGALTVNGATYVSNSEQLTNAVAAGKTNLYLMPGEYDVASCGGKTLTISGTKAAVIKHHNEGEDGMDYGFDGSTVTLNGVTIDTSASSGNYRGYARMNAVYNNCEIIGTYTTSSGSHEFNNCKFDTKNGYIWTWGATAVTFNGCEFGTNSKAILAHGGASTVITIHNCTFAATEKGYTGSGDNTAAVEIDPTGSNTYTINFTGENTKTESYAGWTRIKDGSTGHIITGVNN